MPANGSRVALRFPVNVRFLISTDSDSGSRCFSRDPASRPVPALVVEGPLKVFGPYAPFSRISMVDGDHKLLAVKY